MIWLPPLAQLAHMSIAHSRQGGSEPARCRNAGPLTLCDSWRAIAVTASGQILMTAGRRRRRSGSECVRCSGLTEFREGFADPAGDRGVSFDLTGPAAFDRVLDERVFANQPVP